MISPVCELSICIPTLNRAEYLDKSLASLVSQDAFRLGNSVEIVISDNCSKDNTQDVIARYRQMYPGRITAVRQSSVIPYSGHVSALIGLAHGQYIKICNDTLIYSENALQLMLSKVEEELASANRAFLWFLNTGDGCLEDEVKGLDDFLSKYSYLITSVTPFGLWKEDVLSVCRVFETDTSLIPQTICVVNEFLRGRKVKVVNYEWSKAQSVKRKGGYNIAEVFGRNYLEILISAMRDGGLSRTVYSREKYHLLRNHINKYYFDIDREYAFEKTGYFVHLLRYYWSDLYFYRYYLKQKAKQLLRLVVPKEKEVVLS